jgi:hypothetical protein
MCSVGHSVTRFHKASVMLVYLFSKADIGLTSLEHADKLEFRNGGLV